MNIKTIPPILAATIGLLFPAGARAETPALMPPVKSVYDHYLKIQSELANDSVKGVDVEAGAIAKAVDRDPMKMLPADVAKRAKTLSEAKTLKAARAAFKPLSDSLIKYLARHKAAKGRYFEIYCPMAKAGWLQADKNVKNPYLGSAMLTCGVVKE